MDYGVSEDSARTLGRASYRSEVISVNTTLNYQDTYFRMGFTFAKKK